MTDWAAFVQIDLPALLTGTMAVVLCGLLGNMLVLRGESLLGDAISHAVLPGLVLAFMLTGSRALMPMCAGAALAGIATVVLVSLVRRAGRVESSAAMGVVFSILFALGVLMLERGGASQVDLDPDCVLNGQLEYVFMLPGDDRGFWASLPPELRGLTIALLVTVTLLLLFAKELKVSAFDPAFATSIGVPSGPLDVCYLMLVAIAVVASFQAVGSILVVAMLVCPAATARHLTDRYRTQFLLTAAVAAAAGIGGYVLAATAPAWLGTGKAISAAGMITVVAGGLLAVSIVAGPRHGLVAKAIARRRLAIHVALEDILGLAYRAIEGGVAITTTHVTAALGDGRAVRAALGRGRLDELWRIGDDAAPEAIVLTRGGTERARLLIRRHRLWESYLVNTLGLRPDHVHRTAMELEHVTTGDIEERLEQRTGAVERDPHDKPVP